MAGKSNFVPAETFSKMTPEQRKEYGRQGGIKSGEAKRRKRAMKENLEMLLAMSVKKGKSVDVESIKNFSDIKGKNIPVEQAMMVKLISKALNGDLNAIAMVRDMIGEKPVEQVAIDANIKKNPFDELTADELREIIAKGDSNVTD